MKSALLYGKRVSRGPLLRPTVTSFDSLFDANLPAGWHLASKAQRWTSQGRLMNFVAAGPDNRLVEGSFLAGEGEPQISLRYQPQHSVNEKDLFHHYAGLIDPDGVSARLIVAPGEGQLAMLIPPGNSSHQDFLSRYPDGWQIHFNDPGREDVSEREVLRGLARSNSLDKQSRFLFEQSLSLKDLVAKRGGYRAIMAFSLGHYLYLKRPLKDLQS